MAMSHPADRGPFVPAHRPEGTPLRVLLIALEAEECERVQVWLRRPGMVLRATDADSAAAQALRMLPGVLVVDAQEDARTGVVGRVLECCRAVAMGVVVLLEAHDSAAAPETPRCLHLRRPFDRPRLVAAVEQAARPWRLPAAGHWHARQLREEAETLLELALDLTAPIALPELLQHCADAARHLTGAAFAALFRHGGPHGPHLLAGLSGLPRGAFHGLGPPGETLLLAPTFGGERVIRCDDVHAHPRYGWSPPHRGVPPEHPPVRSYLAVPVTTREGRLLGALLMGHGEPGVFTPHSERLAEAIASQAAAAIEHHLQHATGTSWSGDGGRVGTAGTPIPGSTRASSPREDLARPPRG
jgi:hypothetical protein